MGLRVFTRMAPQGNEMARREAEDILLSTDADFTQLRVEKKHAVMAVEYYTRIAAANLNRAQNWGRLFTYEAAGIETYTWRAVGDERSCPRCSYFDGRTFSTAPAVSLMRKALSEPPEAIEGLAPWPSEDRERDDFYIKTPGGREYIRGKSAGWLQDHGLGMPPLHASCRCVVVAEAA
jgi:hypothetical protein